MYFSSYPFVYYSEKNLLVQYCGQGKSGREIKFISEGQILKTVSLGQFNVNRHFTFKQYFNDNQTAIDIEVDGKSEKYFRQVNLQSYATFGLFSNNFKSYATMKNVKLSED